jgi:hypothetical protein
VEIFVHLPGRRNSLKTRRRVIIADELLAE